MKIDVDNLMAENKFSQNMIKETQDYIIRYQWKDTRNYINKLLNKITRPLQMKEILFANLGEKHEIYTGQVKEKVFKEDLDKPDETGQQDVDEQS